MFVNQEIIFLIQGLGPGKPDNTRADKLQMLLSETTTTAEVIPRPSALDNNDVIYNTMSVNVYLGVGVQDQYNEFGGHFYCSQCVS